MTDGSKTSVRITVSGSHSAACTQSGGPVGHLHGEHQADHDVPDNDDGEIGRRVVGAMMMQLLAAMRAGVGHFQITPEHGPNAASRAFVRGTAQHRGKDRPRVR